MARSYFSGRLASMSALTETPLSDGGVRLDAAPGKATVLIMARTTPRRFFTYDTGRNETLFIELGHDFDPACESFIADRFPAVGLQIANMRIIYRSRRATGELRLNRRLEKRWLRPSRDVFDVSANLRFDEPALDIAGFGEVEIDWRLTVSRFPS